MREQVARAGPVRRRSRCRRPAPATGTWGSRPTSAPSPRCSEHGLDGSQHRARQFDPLAFDDYDLIVVFDGSQERILRNWAQTDDQRDKVRMLLSFDPEQAALRDVPDPYYSDRAMFDAVLVMIERATAALFRQLAPALRQRG